MTDNQGAQPPTPPRQALRLTGDGPIAAPTTAPSAPVAVSLLRVQDGTPAGAADGHEHQIIPFDARRGVQPAIRTHLVAGRVPGAVLYRL